MFKHTAPKKRGSFLPFVIFRLLLSCTILAVFAFGVFQAFRYFSGVDPLELDPKSTIVSLLESDEAVGVVSRFLGFDIGKTVTDRLRESSADPEKKEPTPATDNRDKPVSGPRVLRFAVVADSHTDNENLIKALEEAKKREVKFIIGLGDYSEVGTAEQLQNARQIFISAGLPFYTTAGDHDLWDSRNRGSAGSVEFGKVFGPPYQSFSDSDIRFVIVYNGDNYLGVDPMQMAWLKETLVSAGTDEPKSIFVFTHEPFSHPSSDHMMGKATPGLKTQAKEIMRMLEEVEAAEVFAGDVHAFTRYKDADSGLRMTTVGAVTRERNAEKPSFILVDVFESGGYNVEKVEID